MTLVHANGTAFTTGESACSCRPARGNEEATRLFVPVRVSELTTEAVIDTGGSFLVLPPEVATEIGLTPAAADRTYRINVRGQVWNGHLHRVPLTFLAEQGTGLTIEATAFVPELMEGDEWSLPVYLGLFCCLERLRFAIDPSDQPTFFFGPV